MRIPWIDYPISAIDVETTGLEPTARVVEIGLVCIDRGAVSLEWATRVDPGVPIPASATRVHGITDADVRGAPGTREALQELAARASVGIPLAYNAPFDRSRLLAEAARAGLRDACRALDPAWTGWIDPLVWARRRFRFARGRGRHRLGSVAARLGIAPARAHDALNDARTAALVMFGLWRTGDVPGDLGRLLDTQGRLAAAQEADYASYVARCSRSGATLAAP